MVFCGFPDASDRLAILRACARKLPLAPDMMKAIAQLTVNFTGADMAAVLSEAQLLAVHEQLNAVQQRGHQQQEDIGANSSSSSSGSGNTCLCCACNMCSVLLHVHGYHCQPWSSGGLLLCMRGPSRAVILGLATGSCLVSSSSG
jgi:SpoVK/Ycf46/Vps4 family AAA+-type ATPase